MFCFLENPVYHKLTPQRFRLWAHPLAKPQASFTGALHGPGQELEIPTGSSAGAPGTVLPVLLPGFSGAVKRILVLQKEQDL